MRFFNFRSALSLLVFAVGLTKPLSDLRAQTTPTDRISAISSLSLASRQPVSLYLTTRYGLLRAEPSGMATLVPGLEGGLTSLAAHPGDSKRLLASGYSRDGGKLGLMMSTDGGGSWTKIAEGADGPAAFYALDFSRSDPDVIFGVFDGLQVSRVGGKSWIAGGKLPDDVFDMAVSSVNSDTLYTATKGGLFFSRDGGASWQPGHTIRRPATMVHTAPGGSLYAFVLGVGLITAKEPDLTWTTLFTDVTDRYFLHMAIDPVNPERLYASVDTGAILTSGDGGKSWSSFEGSHTASAERIARGRQVYEDTCQACHGADGIGESPDDPNARDEFGFKAPALNDDAHGWHHSDQNLMNTILTGSSRNERMAAFKETLSGEDVENVVAYVKSLWSFQSLACQGARHMACMGH
jgi:mono/diheme cytochrome c family protein